MAFAGALICRMRSGGIPDEGEDPGRQPHEGQADSTRAAGTS